MGVFPARQKGSFTLVQRQSLLSLLVAMFFATAGCEVLNPNRQIETRIATRLITYGPDVQRASGSLTSIPEILMPYDHKERFAFLNNSLNSPKFRACKSTARPSLPSRRSIGMARAEELLATLQVYIVTGKVSPRFRAFLSGRNFRWTGRRTETHPRKTAFESRLVPGRRLVDADHALGRETEP
jgi:hypothetical protein